MDLIQTGDVKLLNLCSIKLVIVSVLFLCDSAEDNKWPDPFRNFIKSGLLKGISNETSYVLNEGLEILLAMKSCFIWSNLHH